MSGIVGRRVRWKHTKPDGTLEVDLRGEVVACERGGQPSSWSILVAQDDGELRFADPLNVVVEDARKHDVVVLREERDRLQVLAESFQRERDEARQVAEKLRAELASARRKSKKDGAE
jgi:hypothetical protein